MSAIFSSENYLGMLCHCRDDDLGEAWERDRKLDARPTRGPRLLENAPVRNGQARL